MTIRRIKGASGDLYNPKSKAHRLALNQLAKFLREIGFVVECHKNETTLRVYPTKRHQYPLLTPEICCDSFSTVEPCEYLQVAVSSQGDGSNRGTMPCARDALDGYLETFNRHGKRDPRVFLILTGGDFKNHYRHGCFYFPLHFTKAKEIYFESLDKPLRKLWRFLTRLPTSKAGLAGKIGAAVKKREPSGFFGVESYWADPNGGPPIPFEKRNSLADWPSNWDEDQNEDPVMSLDERLWRRNQMLLPGEQPIHLTTGSAAERKRIQEFLDQEIEDS
jgi:hypothetical protein